MGIYDTKKPTAPIHTSSQKLWPQSKVSPYDGLMQMASMVGNSAMEAHLRQEAAPQSTDSGGKELPLSLRERFEAKSGVSLEDVQVHYNSDKPAQLGALAYAQGSEIHIGPGQEKHLEHELGHVVQQKKGLVQPTGDFNGTLVNDDERLERTADKMGNDSDSMQHKAVVFPVVQRIMTEDDFIRDTSPRIGRRGIHNGVYYTSIQQDLAIMHNPASTNNDQIDALIRLRNAVHNWTVDRPNSTRRAVRVQLRDEIDTELFQRWSNLPAPDNYTVGNILFASAPDPDGPIGSIYFNNYGRIRLIHPDGPRISMHIGVARYVLQGTPDEIQAAKTDFGNPPKAQRFAFAVQDPRFLIAHLNIDGGGILFEVFPDGGKHSSRGGPVAFPAIPQPQLNLMYWAARTRDNEILRSAMTWAAAPAPPGAVPAPAVQNIPGFVPINMNA